MMERDWPETFLAHVWAEQRLRAPFLCDDGQRVEVLFAGHHNTMAGPDFVHAVLRLDGLPVRGDVELHHTPADWQAHGHHTDPRYNRVVLHCVFAGEPKATLREDGQRVPILNLQDHLHDDLSLMLRRWKRRKHPLPSPTCPSVASWTPARKRALLRSAGQERLQRKLGRFEAELGFAGWDQLMYAGVLEALGYSANKLAMCALAQGFPWSEITGWQGVDRQTLAAIWMGGSGLLEHLPRQIPHSLATRWRDAYVRQTYHRREVTVSWQLFRQRAANHPAVRLVQAAALLHPMLGKPLHQRLLSLFAVPAGALHAESLRAALAAQFHSDDLPEGLRIGRARLDAYAVNILLPQALLFARHGGHEELAEALQTLWNTWPRMAANKPLKQFEALWGVRCRSAVEQQGALRLWRLYCAQHQCELCTEHIEKG